MMVTYEEKVLEWLFNFDKRIRDVMFSDDFDLLLSNTPVLKYPSIVFSRKAEDWTATRMPTVYGPDQQSFTFQELHQNYDGRIILKSSLRLFSLPLNLGSIGHIILIFQFHFKMKNCL